MIKIENVETHCWEAAIRGMRNPMNSWNKSDSSFMGDVGGQFYIGEDDLKLMTTLANAGSDHGKFLRMIGVSLDITAPLYWWKEFDTYKVGTVANSCSTMHKIAAKEFTIEDFSVEHLLAENTVYFGKTIERLNNARNKFLETKDKKYWWQMIQLLPSSYNQLRTVDLNYEVLLNQYFQRKDHKLDEWRIYCEQIKCFPYLNDFIEVLEK